MSIKRVMQGLDSDNPAVFEGRRQGDRISEFVPLAGFSFSNELDCWDVQTVQLVLSCLIWQGAAWVNNLPETSQITTGWNKGDDSQASASDLRELLVRPHVSQTNKWTAVDERITHHEI
jgi:hypothetical protein